MCLTMDGMSIFILKHICRRDTIDVGPVSRAINSLLHAGAIVRLRSKREDGPFYALVGYVEPTTRRDHSDLYLGRDYGEYYQDEVD